jgi:hypothetical protein
MTKSPLRMSTSLAVSCPTDCNMSNSVGKTAESTITPLRVPRDNRDPSPVIKKIRLLRPYKSMSSAMEPTMRSTEGCVFGDVRPKKTIENKIAAMYRRGLRPCLFFSVFLFSSFSVFE